MTHYTTFFVCHQSAAPAVATSRPLTQQAACRRLHVGVDTFKRFEKLGLIKPVLRLPGGHKRYSAEDVEALKNR